jgi:hypothetical protein
MDVTRLPLGLNRSRESAGRIRLGSGPDRPPSGRFMAWPWQWALDWISHGIEGVLRAKTLPLPDTKPFRDERRWQLAKAIMRRQGFQHGPLDRDELRRATQSLLSFMTSNGAASYRQHPQRGPVFTRDEIAALIQELDEGSILAADGLLRRPYPAPDKIPVFGHVGSAYSDEALRILVEQVHSNALLIYQDLVTTWFPAFAPTLGLACIMPVLFTGRIMPEGDSFSGPDFVYYMGPLPISEPPRAEIHLAVVREDLFGHVRGDPQSMAEYGLRLRHAIGTLHPGAEGWAHPRYGSRTSCCDLRLSVIRT